MREGVSVLVREGGKEGRRDGEREGEREEGKEKERLLSPISRAALPASSGVSAML